VTGIGARALRREDPRLLTGRGRYVGDIARPRMASVVMVRSPHAHARIRAIDTRAARAHPGVLACLTAADLGDVGAIPIRFNVRPGLEPFLQRPLPRERVRYVGEPVAAVVATDQYVAEDARELVRVDYEPLPAVVDVERALAPDAPHLHPGGNRADAWTVAVGDVDAALAGAAHVLRRDFAVHRHTAVPIETRGLVAEWDEGRGLLTVWGPTKVPYFNRGVLAALLGLPEDQIHLIEPDVGGGFGPRGEFYPEDFLVPFLAMRLGRPVRWIEDRMEHFLAINHSRECRIALAVAVDRAARLVALDATVVNDHGGYIRTHGVIVPTIVAAHLPGPYRIPHYRCRVAAVLTNKTPTATMRGPGLFEAAFVRERALDMLAGELGLDPVELRRRNLVPADRMPYAVGTDIGGIPVVHDTGDFPATFERALAVAGWAARRAERDRENAAGGDVRVGVGLACIAEPSGWGPYETAKVLVTPAGKLHVYTGAASMGQGHETTLAQVAAEVLHVPLADIVVRHGDTGLMPYGMGSYASRAAVMAGSAVHGAAVKLAARIRAIAARHFEVDPADLVFEDGRVGVRGVPGRTLTLRELAALVAPRRPVPGGPPPGHAAEPLPEGEPLEALHYHHTSHETSSFGVHVAVVAVDTRTGVVTPRRYAIVADVGRAINPAIVEGQLVGGVAHGLGGTLLEELVYDEHGQLLTTTFMDYLLPSAGEVPPIDVTLVEAPTPSNPLGVKGAGEAGTSGAGAAFANAVADALGLPITSLPLSPRRLLAMLEGAPAGPGPGRA